jgi:hypothetical protein
LLENTCEQPSSTLFTSMTERKPPSRRFGFLGWITAAFDTYSDANASDCFADEAGALAQHQRAGRPTRWLYLVKVDY